MCEGAGAWTRESDAHTNNSWKRYFKYLIGRLKKSCRFLLSYLCCWYCTEWLFTEEIEKLTHNPQPNSLSFFRNRLLIKLPVVKRTKDFPQKWVPNKISQWSGLACLCQLPLASNMGRLRQKYRYFSYTNSSERQYSNTCFESSFRVGFDSALNCLFAQGQFAFIPHFVLTEWTISPTS